MQSPIKKTGESGDAIACKTDETKELTVTEERRKELDYIIDSLRLERYTGLSREEIHINVDRASTLMDLTICLTDVIDSLMLDVINISDKVKVPLTDDRELSYFKEMKKLANATRKWANRITRNIQDSERDGDLAKESDWWYKLILMVEDRTGTDNLKTKQVLQWLSTMPSEMHLFDNIHTKDFEVLV